MCCKTEPKPYKLKKEEFFSIDTVLTMFLVQISDKLITREPGAASKPWEMNT